MSYSQRNFRREPIQDLDGRSMLGLIVLLAVTLCVVWVLAP